MRDWPRSLGRVPRPLYSGRMAPVTMKAFKSALESGRLDPVYLFHGTDDFLKEEKVRALIAAATDPSTRDFNLEQLRGAECDVARLSGALEALPMLADRRVVILRDPEALKKPALERLTRHVEKPASDTCLVLVVPGGAKPPADLLKSSSALEFRALTDEELQQWLALEAPKACGTTILPEAATLLASYTGNDLALLSGELQKLAAYTDGKPIVPDAGQACTLVGAGHTLGDLPCRAERCTFPVEPGIARSTLLACRADTAASLAIHTLVLIRAISFRAATSLEGAGSAIAQNGAFRILFLVTVAAKIVIARIGFTGSTHFTRSTASADARKACGTRDIGAVGSLFCRQLA